MQFFEQEAGVFLPDDFRRFCLLVASRAPCPFTPPPSRRNLFGIYLDQSGGTFDECELLLDLRNTESSSRLQRPFPFEHKQTLIFTSSQVQGLYPTQTECNDFTPAGCFEGLPVGSAPFDGLLELWSELQYCDLWCIRYGLVVTGNARGQVWASAVHTHASIPDGATLTIHPIASSFCAWYAAWLRE